MKKQEAMKELVPLIEVSEIELIYKTKAKFSNRPIIKNSKQAGEIFMRCYEKNKIGLIEQFFAMFLNRANRVLGIYKLSSGGITGTVADPRLLLCAAIKIGAVNILICHNHPSGNPRPSKADQELTLKIKEGARYFDIRLLDHIILSEEEGFYSMADDGII